MNASSYNAILDVLRDGHLTNWMDTPNTDTTVTVNRTDLLNLFKELRRYHRRAGIMGYNYDGYVLVNDVGIVPVIKQQFAEDFPDYKFDSISISRKVPELEWKVTGVCGELSITTTYRFDYLEQKYNIKYVIP